MRDTTRLSSHKPLFDTIKAIFILINDVAFQLRKAKNKFHGQLKVEILGEELDFKDHVNENLTYLT